MKARTWLLGSACLLVAACGDDGEPQTPFSDGQKPAPSDIAPTTAKTTNLMNDFVPGDPTFVREQRLNVENESKQGELRSHTRSRNCLTCHQNAGPGKGVFTIAGTLLDEKGIPVPNGVLKLFATKQAVGGGAVVTGAPFELADEVMTLQLDGNGNFFTTRPLPAPFPEAPLYPQFFSRDLKPLWKADGKLEAIMGGGITVGGCNFCHGEKFPIVGRSARAE